MKRGKSIIAGLIVFSMLSTMLIGCSNDENDEKPATPEPTSSVESAEEENPFKDPMEISIAFWEIEKSFAKGEDDELLQKMQNDFNIKFKPVSVTWSDWTEKYLIYAASDQLPDVFAHDLVGTSTYYTWIDQKLVRPVPSDLSEYPMVEKIFESPDVKALKHEDGNFYMIPRQTYKTFDMWALDRTILLRKDWMEKLNIKEPESFDDFKNMLKAFVEQDPDGNGKDDTVGLAVNGVGWTTALFLQSFPEFTNYSRGWMKEDGKWIPVYASKKAADAVVQLRELYTENLIDKDFPIQKDGDAKSKFAQGKAGAFCFNSGLGWTDWDKYNPGVSMASKVDYIKMWPAPDGNRYKFTDSTFWSESYFNNKVDDKKMDRILRMYDYLLTDEGAVAVRAGIEGKDFEYDGDKLVITRDKDKNLDEMYPSRDVFKSMACWQQERDYLKNELNYGIFGKEKVDLASDTMDWYSKNAKILDYNYDISFMSTPHKDKLPAKNELEDEFTKVILGKEDAKKMWNDTIQKFKDERGLDEAIDEVTKKAAELGIE